GVHGDGAMARARFRTRLVGALAMAATVGCVGRSERPPDPERASMAYPLPAGLSRRNQPPAGDERRPATVAPRGAGAVVPAAAADPVPEGLLSLDQLEQLAEAHNPILQRDLAKLESARGQALQAGLY